MRQNRLDGKVKQELKKRLQASYGEKTTAVASTKDGSQRQPQTIRGRSGKKAIDTSPQSNFMQELIKPCNCSVNFHRVCIREKIVRGLLKQCPECQADYSVGFTDCYAIFNKVRPNYLGYMFVQEILFYLSIIAFCEVVRTTA